MAKWPQFSTQNTSQTELELKRAQQTQVSPPHSGKNRATNKKNETKIEETFKKHA